MYPAHTPSKLFVAAKYIGLLCLALTINSCASAPAKSTRLPSGPSAFRSDIVHTVAPGETLWRISKMYNVPAQTILTANKLSENNPLQLGQRLFIPGAADVTPVISLFPSTKWEYIIVHHSATETGSSLAFNTIHINKGWDRGIGYHFVIDNGTDGKKEGQVEVTPRWLKQEDGAHTKASDMNTKAIGICLVGNFSEERVSPKQMDSLVDLVNTLRHYYKIPLSHIMGHGQVKDAATECPGKNFPWEGFMYRLSRDR